MGNLRKDQTGLFELIVLAEATFFMDHMVHCLLDEILRWIFPGFWSNK